MMALELRPPNFFSHPLPENINSGDKTLNLKGKL